MLRRLRIDHVACLCDATLNLGGVTLIEGLNGTGKSVMLFVLDTVLQLTRSVQPPGELFGANLRCLWSDGPAQIELELEHNGERFEYELSAPFEGARGSEPISERLLRNGELIYENRASKVAWRAADGTMPAPWVPARGGSLLGGLEESHWPPGQPFHEALRQVRWFWVNTVDLLDRSDETHDQLDPWLTNFAAWLRGLQRRDPALLARAYDDIRALVPGFVGLRLQGEPTDLYAELVGPSDSPHRYVPFNLLSQGQQRLALLTTLALGQLAPGVTLWLDEPCSELHPSTARIWLRWLANRAREVGAQVIVSTAMERTSEALQPDRWLQLVRPAEECTNVEEVPR